MNSLDASKTLVDEDDDKNNDDKNNCAKQIQQQNSAKNSTSSSSHIIPPPSEFRGSPCSSSTAEMINSSNASSSTASSLNGDQRRGFMITADGQNATYDIMTGLDGADLRYMDESSVIVPSPSYESPPSSFSCSLANPLSTAPSSPLLGPHTTSAGSVGLNTSLLQAALIRATAQSSSSGQK